MYKRQEDEDDDDDDDFDDDDDDDDVEDKLQDSDDDDFQGMLYRWFMCIGNKNCNDDVCRVSRGENTQEQMDDER